MHPDSLPSGVGFPVFDPVAFRLISTRIFFHPGEFFFTSQKGAPFFLFPGLFPKAQKGF